MGVVLGMHGYTPHESDDEGQCHGQAFGSDHYVFVCFHAANLVKRYGYTKYVRTKNGKRSEFEVIRLQIQAHSGHCSHLPDATENRGGGKREGERQE